MYSFTIYDSTISLHKNRGIQRNDGKCNHYGILYRVLNMLKDCGFVVTNDDKVDKIIRKDYFYGRRDELEFSASRYPAGFEITFFQNVIYKNPNGGRYDFDKLNGMPYLTRMKCTLYLRKISRFFISEIGIKNCTEQSYKFAEDKIKYRYVRSVHAEQQSMNFNLSDLDGQTVEGRNGLDRNGKTIRNGDVKYFRDYDGYIRRGRVYHNLNNMWYVIQDKFTVRNIASFELFDFTNDICLKRQKKPNIPKEYADRRKAISETSTKELIRELRRRNSLTDCKNHPDFVASRNKAAERLFALNRR